MVRTRFFASDPTENDRFPSWTFILTSETDGDTFWSSRFSQVVSWWPFDPVVHLAGSSASSSPLGEVAPFWSTLYPLQVFLGRRRKFPLPLRGNQDDSLDVSKHWSSSHHHHHHDLTVDAAGWLWWGLLFSSWLVVDQQDGWLSPEETRTCWPAGVLWACQNAVHQSEPILLAVRVWHFTCEQMFYRKESCLQTVRPGFFAAAAVFILWSCESWRILLK